MSKKYSVSLVTFFQDVMVVSYHGLKRGSRNMGVTIPPSMFDFYVRVRPSRVFNTKTEEKSTHWDFRWDNWRDGRVGLLHLT